jgi:thioredoxin 1
LILTAALLIALIAASCGGNEESPGGDEATTGGSTKFLYFYTDECAPCKEMNPIVDGIEADFKDRLVVERHDANSEAGQQLMTQYAVTDPPSYVILAPDGTKLWAINGAIHKDMLRQQVQLHIKK